MATYASILAWRIPWTKESSGLYIVHGVANSQTGLSDFHISCKALASPVAQWFKKKKNLPAVQETVVRSLDWEDSLEEAMATHSSVLFGQSHGQRKLEGYSL